MSTKTILVVDDQPELIKRIATELYKEGYKVINASNGEIAYQIALEEKPDVILMDWDMPVLNGVEATKKLKQSEVTFEIPVVIVTGQMTSSDDLKVAMNAGAEDFVRKPIDFVELLARVNTALRIREQHESIKGLLKSELELKNRKLSSTSMLIVEKNDLLQTFYENLDSLQQVIDEPNTANSKLEELKRQVRHLLDLDASWDIFKMHFDEVHPGFFENLSKRYADLSHKDLKLCAYLKLGIENKQIANLLNISAASASTALFRLKKRMELEEEANLRQFILEM